MITLLLLFLLVVNVPTTSTGGSNSVSDTLKQRMKILQLVARADPRHANNGKSCDSKRLLRITEYPFGRNGNQLIELTHGLWISSHYNRTLIIPDWMAGVLVPFNSTFLRSIFCLIDHHMPPIDADVLDVESSDSFFAFNLASKAPFIDLFHLEKVETDTIVRTVMYSHAVVAEVTKVLVRVYSALWSTPLLEVVQPAVQVIEHHLKNSFRYASVHKRSLEGGCHQLLSENTIVSDYSPLEIPMDHPEWSGRLRKHHPLCHMSESFVSHTLMLHNRSLDTPIFVAFDGHGDISDYRRSNRSVFIDDVLPGQLQMPIKMFVEMFIAMHSDLFIMNPRSTFSWQIFVVRACLGLRSVPELHGNFDLFLQTEKEMSRRPPWVSWDTVKQACLSI